MTSLERRTEYLLDRLEFGRLHFAHRFLGDKTERAVALQEAGLAVWFTDITAQSTATSLTA